MARVGSLVDILLFYTIERLLFNKMVCSMGKNPQMVKKALALWLMLEEIGYHDLIRMIHSFDNNTIEALFDEGLQCLECIQPNAIELSESEDTQVFVGLLDGPMNRRFFYYNREFMHESYMHVMETVCDKIFGETLAIECSPRIFRTHNEPGEVLAHASDEVPKQSNLNPNASEFYPRQTPEETRNWGPVVKEVVIERTRPGKDPVYGRIIFTTSLVIPMVLNGQVKAKFLVNSKHLRARIYVPRHQGSEKNRI
ncbi:hypothetical protein ACJW31_10G040500 [Castanea mollissima]